MTDTALTIRKDWPRVDAVTLKALESVTASQLSDAMGGVGALDRTITRQAGGSARICGSALTVWTSPGDNLAPYAALAVARPGDVLVLACDRHEGCALLGDTIVGLMRNAGAVGVVTDALVRDLDGLDAIGVPVYARGVSPRAPGKKGPGEIGIPVTIGGVLVRAGDLVMADRDGVVVLPREGLAAIADKLAAVLEKEARADTRVRDGATEPADFQAMLNAAGVQWS